MATNKKTEAVETTAETTPKKVKIRLPLTREEKDDVYVCVNGKSYLIKRGKEVEVPASVAEALSGLTTLVKLRQS